MEDKSQYMAEKTFEPVSSTLIPIALGLIGIALGGSALYFSLTTPVRVENRRDTNGVFESRIRSLEEELTEFKAENEALRTDLLSLAQQTQIALEKVSGEFSRTREEIASIQALARPQSVPRLENLVPETGIKRVEKTETEENASVGGYHTVRAGDTFAKIARELGMSMNVLLQANPGVDPRKLQVGQKIVIPVR